ncbi:MAG: metal ABC transporter ATP-binding protein [Armatimonadota bacterium]|nr:metal ABC transporter ATP-binding protein [bacterium]
MNSNNKNNNQDTVLEFADVNLGYGKRTIISNVNLTLSHGDFLGIVGPNGTGKTTILKAILGILQPLSGRITRQPKARFGYVPQRQFIDEVYPFTVMDVALMGRYTLLGVFGKPHQSDKETVMNCLNHVGIADLANRQYRELSGGQKQRTLIARALAMEPEILILDEPTNDMDIGSEYAIMELLAKFNQTDSLTIVMVSHLLNVVANYAKTLALIDEGIKAMGKIEDVLSSDKLTSIYGIPVEVASCGSQRVVITGGCDA